MKSTMKWGVIRSIEVQYGTAKPQVVQMVDPDTITDSKHEAIYSALDNGKLTRVLHVY